ncbi:MAG: hypothetical protein HC862_22395 [Scytonema sp. RU_4_4]|nr:hypothetical protein [Scytonema sp. RU_4_4]
MSFLANIFNLALKKIVNWNLPFESEVGECWIELNLSADGRFMHSSVYAQRSRALLGKFSLSKAFRASGVGRAKRCSQREPPKGRSQLGRQRQQYHFGARMTENLKL